MIIAPFLPGHGPSIEIDADDAQHTSGCIRIANNARGTWPGAAAVPLEGTIVFKWERYRAGLGVRDASAMVEDLLAFCTAYVERPEEFDRTGEYAPPPAAPVSHGNTPSALRAYAAALEIYAAQLEEWKACNGKVAYPEQQYAAFWRCYGEHFACALSSSEEDDDEVSSEDDDTSEE
jgi:hypothetical protein